MKLLASIFLLAGMLCAPFSELFGSIAPGRSDVGTGLHTFDRSGEDLFGPSGITPTPPLPALPPPLPYETQVVMLASTNQTLPAGHPLSVRLDDSYSAGVTHLNLSGGYTSTPHRLRASHEGLQLQGLPVIGFEAINYVNSNVTPGVLANYSAAFPIRSRAPCVVDSSARVNVTCP